MSAAGSAREPLLGTAMRSMGFLRWERRSEVGVDVVQGDVRGEHQHLQVVEQLADLLSRARLTLVLGRHPDLGRLLDDLLADRMDAGVQLGHGARAHGPGRRLVGELGEQLVEGLHGSQGYGAPAGVLSTRPSVYGPVTVTGAGALTPTRTMARPAFAVT